MITINGKSYTAQRAMTQNVTTGGETLCGKGRARTVAVKDGDWEDYEALADIASAKYFLGESHEKALHVMVRGGTWQGFHKWRLVEA